MKHLDLVNKLNQMGCVLIRHGGDHDIYKNPRTHAWQPVPRHRAIKNYLARRIIKALSDPS